jgi:hypothetical protein
MSPTQRRFAAGGWKYCCCRFSTTAQPVGCTQLLMDPGVAVEAHVLPEYRLDLSGDYSTRG